MRMVWSSWTRRIAAGGAATLLVGGFTGLVLPASAATPGSGRVTPTAPTLHYTAGPFVTPQRDRYVGRGELHGPRVLRRLLPDRCHPRWLRHVAQPHGCRCPGPRRLPTSTSTCSTAPAARWPPRRRRPTRRSCRCRPTPARTPCGWCRTPRPGRASAPAWPWWARRAPRRCPARPPPGSAPFPAPASPCPTRTTPASRRSGSTAVPAKRSSSRTCRPTGSASPTPGVAPPPRTSTAAPASRAVARSASTQSLDPILSTDRRTGRTIESQLADARAIGSLSCVTSDDGGHLVDEPGRRVQLRRRPPDPGVGPVRPGRRGCGPVVPQRAVLLLAGHRRRLLLHQHRPAA